MKTQVDVTINDYKARLDSISDTIFLVGYRVTSTVI